MCNQKFKATVFVPRLTEIASIVEIDVDPHDSETDVCQKIIKKMGINEFHHGVLLTKKSMSKKIDWAKLISYEKIKSSRLSYVDI